MVLDVPGVVAEVLDLLGRAGELMDRADAVLTRAEAAVERGEDILARAEAAVTRSEDTLTQAGAAVVASEAMLARTALVLGDAEGSAAGMAVLLARTEGILGRGEVMLRPVEELSAVALPIVQRVMDTTDPHEVEAVIGMINHLPALLAHLEDDVLPMLSTLDQVGPDVHGILDDVRGITIALSGFPGIGYLQRRGERKDRAGRGIAYGQDHREAGGHTVPGQTTPEIGRLSRELTADRGDDPGAVGGVARPHEQFREAGRGGDGAARRRQPRLRDTRHAGGRHRDDAPSGGHDASTP